MIVDTHIDEDGAVMVHIDTDGDHGDGYSTDVMQDMVTRAGEAALKLWFSAYAALAMPDEPLEDDTHDGPLD